MARAAEGEATFAELRDRGAGHYERREYAEAIDAFTRAKAVSGGRATDEEYVRRLLARTKSALAAEFYRAGELREADRLYREALAEAEDFYANFALGYSRLLAFDDDEAFRYLQKALDLEPKDARTHALLAVLHYRGGRSARALELIDEAVRLDKNDAESLLLQKRWQHEVPFAARLRDARHGRFLVRFDKRLPSADVALVVRLLKQAAGELQEALGWNLRRTVVVVLFREQDFHAATGSRHFVGGTYDGQLKLPLTPELSERPEIEAALLRSVRHELTHVVLARMAPGCPNWLGEGIAQYFERGGERKDVYRLLWKKRAGRTTLDQTPARLWLVGDEQVVRMSYLQGFAFVEFLSERYHEFRLHLLLRSIALGGSLRAAFEETYGLGLRQLEESMWRHVASAAASDS